MNGAVRCGKKLRGTLVDIPLNAEFLTTAGTAASAATTSASTTIFFVGKG